MSLTARSTLQNNVKLVYNGLIIIVNKYNINMFPNCFNSQENITSTNFDLLKDAIINRTEYRDSIWNYDEI